VSIWIIFLEIQAAVGNVPTLSLIGLSTGLCVICEVRLGLRYIDLLLHIDRRNTQQSR
jgi:hypothetical protein